MIYLASPYSHPDHAVMEDRFNAVCRVSAKLMLRGVLLFSPIAHTHPIAVAGELPRGWDFWHAYDRWFVSNCDELWVLRLDGWRESKGVSAEIALAVEYSKAVVYLREDGERDANITEEDD